MRFPIELRSRRVGSIGRCAPPAQLAPALEPGRVCRQSALVADPGSARALLAPCGARSQAEARLMNGIGSNWAVVLAAGDGTRLAALTRDAAGNAVPKQFCSLNGGRTLVQEAVERARRIVPLDRTCAIVAQRHSQHWRQALCCLPAENIIVQPQNR